MLKTITSDEARQRLDSLMSDVADRGEEVIVTHHGKPCLAIISIASHEEAQRLRLELRGDDESVPHD